MLAALSATFCQHNWISCLTRHHHHHHHCPEKPPDPLQKFPFVFPQPPLPLPLPPPYPPIPPPFRHPPHFAIYARNFNAIPIGFTGEFRFASEYEFKFWITIPFSGHALLFDLRCQILSLICKSRTHKTQIFLINLFNAKMGCTQLSSQRKLKLLKYECLSGKAVSSTVC